jgi:hypothetical protein
MYQVWSKSIEGCSTPLTGFELATLVVTGTDCTGSCKLNNHMITTMTVPYYPLANEVAKGYSNATVLP